MSRSILKSSDSARRVVPVPASEGLDMDALSRPRNVHVEPWTPEDDVMTLSPHLGIDQHLSDVQAEIETIRTNIENMHRQMMTSTPMLMAAPNHQPFAPFRPLPQQFEQPKMLPMPFEQPKMLPMPFEQPKMLPLPPVPATPTLMDLPSPMPTLGHPASPKYLHPNSNSNQSPSPSNGRDVRSPLALTMPSPPASPRGFGSSPMHHHGLLQTTVSPSHPGVVAPPGMALTPALPSPAVSHVGLPAMQPAAPRITTDENGYRILQLVLDFDGYDPEDININTSGSVLYIHACRLVRKEGSFKDPRHQHHNNSASMNSRETAMMNSREMKECRRKYTLPEVVRAENLRCYVNHKKQLTIEGPLGPDVLGTYRKKRVKFAAGKM